MNQPNTAELISKLESYCAYQERCEFEIRNKLVSLNAEENQINEVLAHLKKMNFFDQNRFVEAYAIGKLRSNKWGRLKIKAALIQKKVSREHIFYGLSKIDDLEYHSILNMLVKRKINELVNEKDKWTKKQKILRFLTSKGFEYDEIISSLGND
ncbi:MAG: regulatory protein RecX [Bacteroidota bacterium]